MNTDEERLIKEKKFLEESIGSGIITQEEYDRAIQRIEKEMSGVREAPETPKATTQPKKSTSSKKSTFNIEQLNAKINTPEPVFAPAESFSTDKPETPKNQPKTGRWIVALILLVFIALFWWKINLPADNFIPDVPNPIPGPTGCSSDTDCEEKQRCENPGTNRATCVISQQPGTITVFTSPQCPFCDTASLEQGLTQLFPDVLIYHADDPDLDWYPLIVFDSEVTKQKMFSQLKEATESSTDRSTIKANAMNTIYLPNRVQKKGVEVYVAPYASSTAAALQSLTDFDHPLTIHFVGQVKNDALIPRAGGSTLRNDRELTCVTHMLPEQALTALTCMLVRGGSLEQCVTDYHSLDSCATGQQSLDYLRNDYTTIADFGVTTSPAYIINNQFRVSGYMTAKELGEKYCMVNEC